MTHHHSDQPSRLRQGALLCALAGVLAGCSPRDPDREKAASWPAALRDKRAEWSAYLDDKSLLLVCGATIVAVIRSTHGFHATFDHPALSVGTAIVISEDGYLLSAAHVTRNGGPYWVTLGPGNAMACRLVWCPDNTLPNDDWVLLKAPHRFADTLPWSTSPLVPGDMVIAGSLSARAAHGLVGAVWSLTAPDHAYTVIIHSAPLIAGDSGGPLVDAEGALLGIDYGGDQDWLGRCTRSYAVRPDPAFVQRLIDQDRQGHGDGADAPPASTAPAP